MVVKRILGIVMRSETISDNQTGIINRSLYQLEEEKKSDNSDPQVMSEVDRILRRLDQIERLDE